MSNFGSARIERKKFWDRMRIYGYVSGGVLFIILLLYIFTVSPFFKIKNIAVISPAEIDENVTITSVKEQVRLASGLLGSDSYFSWKTNANYTAPNASSIKVEKNLLTRTVTLTVEPRDRFMVWCSDEPDPDATVGAGCFWVDQTGTIFERAPITDGQLVQAIYDNATENQFALGKQILDKKSFDSVSKIFKSDIIKQIGIASITLSRSLQEITATTNSGTKLIFSMRFDPEASALPALAKFIETIGLNKLTYVNMTVENRAFVKYK